MLRIVSRICELALKMFNWFLIEIKHTCMTAKIMHIIIFSTFLDFRSQIIRIFFEDYLVFSNIKWDSHNIIISEKQFCFLDALSHSESFATKNWLKYICKNLFFLSTWHRFQKSRSQLMKVNKNLYWLVYHFSSISV